MLAYLNDNDWTRMGCGVNMWQMIYENLSLDPPFIHSFMA